MKKTRLSLFYLTGYLFLGGIGFSLVPQTILRMFLSNGNYSDVMVRLVGVLMISLGIIVIQIIRHRAVFLYLTTLVIRTFILSALTFFYVLYGDPMFVVLITIVGVGFLLTLSCYLLDRKRERAWPDTGP